jgi:hypothetical protein
MGSLLLWATQLIANDYKTFEYFLHFRFHRVLEEEEVLILAFSIALEVLVLVASQLLNQLI